MPKAPGEGPPTGAFDWVWYVDVVLAVAAALIHLPIREPALRPAAA